MEIAILTTILQQFELTYFYYLKNNNGDNMLKMFLCDHLKNRKGELCIKTVPLNCGKAKQ